MIEPPGAVKGSADEMAAGIKAATAKIPGHTGDAGFKQGLRCLLGGARRLWAACGAGPVPADLPLAMDTRSSNKVVLIPQMGEAA